MSDTTNVKLYKVFNADNVEVGEYNEDEYDKALARLEKTGPGAMLERWGAEVVSNRGYWDEYHGGCPPEAEVSGKYFVQEVTTWEREFGGSENENSH